MQQTSIPAVNGIRTRNRSNHLPIYTFDRTDTGIAE
jgi:hypothetical protein